MILIRMKKGHQIQKVCFDTMGLAKRVMGRGRESVDSVLRNLFFPSPISTFSYFHFYKLHFRFYPRFFFVRSVIRICVFV